MLMLTLNEKVEATIHDLIGCIKERPGEFMHLDATSLVRTLKTVIAVLTGIYKETEPPQNVATQRVGNTSDGPTTLETGPGTKN